MDLKLQYGHSAEGMVIDDGRVWDYGCVDVILLEYRV